MLSELKIGSIIIANDLLGFVVKFDEATITLKPVFELIGKVIEVLYGVVVGVVNGIIAALGPFLSAVLDVANAIIEVIKFVCAILKGDWSDAWTHMQNIATSIWSAIKNIFLGIWEFIKGFGQGFVDFFKGIGHGYGMSQYGADRYAKEGKDYRWILAHYFHDISIKTV